MYKRILLKISGESLSCKNKFGINVEKITQIAEQICSIHKLGIDVCVVTGGGNILRGVNLEMQGIERTTADHMGMISTIINSLALKNAIETFGHASRILSAIPVIGICEPYIRQKAISHIAKKRIVIFAAGTGNPFFSTDTAAVLRAIEMECDILLKGTKVNGVYSGDPITNNNVELYKEIDYKKVIEKELKVMDSAAIALAKDHSLPIIVFALKENNSIEQVVKGKGTYTLISKKAKTNS